jgi:molybdate-binding protein/DNA-binding XRE family transcriptional regulator
MLRFPAIGAKGVLTGVEMLQNEVRAYRSHFGWSQDELARRTGLSRAGISAIETGRLVPSTAAALALAAALECSVEALFRLRGDQTDDRGADWAWAPRAEDMRYWCALVGGRRRLYPVEFSSLGLIPHDGTSADGTCHESIQADPSRTLVLASCDPAVGLLAAQIARTDGFRLIVLPRSSRAALDLLARGLVHAAGVHLARSDSSDANATEAREQLHGGSEPAYQLVRVADWEEGIALARGLNLKTIRAVVGAKLRWIGREAGSAAQQCLEEILGHSAQDHPRRRLRRVTGHRAVADAIRASWADVGVCLRLACAEAELQFLGVRSEAYEICMGDSFLHDARGKALLQVLQSAAFRRILGDLPGYDISRTGEVQRIRLGAHGRSPTPCESPLT